MAVQQKKMREGEEAAAKPGSAPPKRAKWYAWIIASEDHFLVFAILVMGAPYAVFLVWRLGFSRDPLWNSLLILLAELASFIWGVVVWKFFLAPRGKPPPETDRAGMASDEEKKDTGKRV